MEPVPLFTGMVIGGKFRLDNKARFAKLVKSLEGKQIALSLGEHQNLRSLKQNGWYWSVAIPLIAATQGYTNLQAHEGLKDMFLKINTDSPLPTVRSTAELNTKEFSEFMEHVIQFGAEELGVLIPYPNEMT